jgi:hypothetical protein
MASVAISLQKLRLDAEEITEETSLANDITDLTENTLCQDEVRYILEEADLELQQRGIKADGITIIPYFQTRY